MSKPLIPEIRFKDYDDEWLPTLLKEVGGDFKYGLNASATSFDNVHKYLRITDIHEDSRKFIQTSLTSPNISYFPDEYKLRENDIVFARTGASVGKTYLYNSADENVYWAGFLIRLHIKDDYDSQFIFQNTQTKDYRQYIAITSQRSGQPGVNAEEYGNYSFYTPSDIKEQREVGSYLSCIDTMLVEVERELDRLEKMKLASLQKMFPRPGATTPEVRFAGFSGEWAVKKIGQIFSEGNARGCNGTPLSVSIVRGVYPTEDFVKTVTVKDFSNYKLVDEGDIVYNSMRMWQGASGVSYWNGFVSPAYTVLRPREDEHICSEFFAYLFKLDWVIKIFEANSQGLTKDTWNLKYPAISQIELPIPSDEKEQIQIAEYFRSLDALIVAKREKLTKLRNIKKSCLDKMFVNTSDL